MDPRSNPLRILVVEDNDDGRTMLEAMLRLDGYAVRTASDGAGALEIAATGWPEVAIVDVGLPDIDGCEVARRIRKSNAPIRLIALTGHGLASDKQRAHEAGFDLHLIKPAMPEVLANVLAALMARRGVLHSTDHVIVPGDEARS
jgi:CheY-like chemotaxis protein